MSIYKTNVSVDIHDVDLNGIARFSALMRYIQTAAQSQLTERGYSFDELRDRNRAFILSRIKIEFDEPCRAYDRLEAISFPCHSRGYSFLRCYQLNKGEKTIGRAASVWALIDTETRALVRVNDFEFGLTTEDPLALTPTHFALPQKMHKVGNYTVYYSDTDQNRHMNNTRYPDMYSNFLPLDGKRIRSMSIAYMNEAPLGEVLSVEMAENDGFYYFRTVRSDGKINSEAQIELCEI